MKARDLGIERIAGRDDGARRARTLVESTTFGDQEFLFLNLMEAHGPYKAPSAYRTVELESNPSFEDTIFDGPDEDAETIRQAYDDCVRYLSDIYEDIFATLSRDFDYVITVSDHGELFGRDGIWDHNYGIYPELTHVPLSVFEGSDGIAHRDDTVSIRDIYATIVAVADGSTPDTGGRNILADADTRSQFVERFGLRTSRVEKLRNKGYDDAFIREHDQPFFGLATDSGAYAWESRQGIQYEGHIDEENAARRIREYRDGVDPIERTDSQQTDVPSDVEAQLEELGYL